MQTYEGVAGFKRMLWHELKAKGDCLCLGTGALEDLVGNRRWAERHRLLTVAAGYNVREICNPEASSDPTSRVAGFYDLYELRVVPRDVLTINYMVSKRGSAY